MKYRMKIPTLCWLIVISLFLGKSAFNQCDAQNPHRVKDMLNGNVKRLIWTERSTESSEILYNEQGNRTKMTMKSGENILSIEKYLYDSSDKLVEMLITNQEGETSRYLYMYDINGNRTSRAEFINNSILVENLVYEYDDDSKKVTITVFDFDSTLTERLVRKVDDTAVVLEEAKWSREPDTQSSEKYEYGLDGKLLKTTRTYTSERSISRKEYHYNSRGDVTEVVDYEMYGEAVLSRLVYDYNNDSNTIAIKEYDSDGKLKKEYEEDWVIEEFILCDKNSERIPGFDWILCVYRDDLMGIRMELEKGQTNRIDDSWNRTEDLDNGGKGVIQWALEPDGGLTRLYSEYSVERESNTTYLSSIYSHRYDLNNNLIEHTYDFDPMSDSLYGYHHLFSYDESGLLIERRNRTNLGNDNQEFTESRYTYLYNSNGDVVRENITYGANQVLRSSTNLSYNSENQLTERKVLSYECVLPCTDDFKLISSKKFNSHGQVEELKMFENSNLDYQCEYKYNDANQLTRMSCYDEDGEIYNEETLGVEFDEKGNWIKKIVEDWDGEVTVSERILYYYE